LEGGKAVISLKVQPVKKEYLDLAWKRLNNLTKPVGSLGMLEEIAARLVAIYEDPMPEIKGKVDFCLCLRPWSGGRGSISLS